MYTLIDAKPHTPLSLSPFTVYVICTFVVRSCGKGTPYIYNVTVVNELRKLSCSNAYTTQWTDRQWKSTYVESCSLEMRKHFGNEPYRNGQHGISVVENPLTYMTSCEKSEAAESSWVDLSVCCHRKLVRLIRQTTMIIFHIFICLRSKEENMQKYREQKIIFVNIQKHVANNEI